MTSCKFEGPVLFHTGIAVPDLEASRVELSAALGVRWHPVAERTILMATPTASTEVLLRYCYSETGPHHLELIEGVTGTIYDAAGGARLHHIGFGASDIESAADDLEAAGVAWVGGYRPSEDGPPVFTYHRSLASPLIELVSESVRLRVTGPDGHGPP